MPNFSIPLSGLTAESTALSTIANNLANQETVGYKSKVVLFSDLFYQNLGTSGSGDPIQMGAGTQVCATPSLFTQGSVSSTGVDTDVAIQGAGFFVVQDPSGVLNYTRAGDFTEIDNLRDSNRTAGIRLPGGQWGYRYWGRNRPAATRSGYHQPANGYQQCATDHKPQRRGDSQRSSVLYSPSRV
jgi:flagellar hook-basal body protein